MVKEEKEMKITQLLNMTKIHILRVILCSIATMSILITVGLINRVYLYIFTRWNLDIIQNNISGSIPVEYILIILLWNYIVGFAVAGLLWKYFGIPKITFFGKVYRRFMDIYYVD